jgi:hypothetical protein
VGNLYKKVNLRGVSVVLALLLIFQLFSFKPVFAYDAFSLGGKPLNDVMTGIAGFGVYGNESNGTGVATGVTPSGMTIPQEQKNGEWLYFGYSYADVAVTNSAFVGDYDTFHLYCQTVK